MNRALPIVVLAGLAVALSAGSVLAGRGGGGGFQGARPRGAGVSSTAGGPSGGARLHGGGSGGHGGNFSTPGRLSPATRRRSTCHAPTSGRPRCPSTSARPTRSADRRRPTGPSLVLVPTPRPRPGPRPDNLAPRQDWPRHDWYHGDWHGHWDHPWNRWPYGWFDAGAVWGVAAVTPWSWGYWPYYNPYCIAPVVIDGVTIDYSQPIAAAVPPEPLVGQGLAADEASQLLDAARDAFLRGNYPAALNQADRAIASNPADPLPHEFRCLACFALKQYKEAAAGAYAVLSAGPGWDWTTLSSFYPDVNIYAQQLRALEQYVKAHPDQPDVRFLLAYHYLTCGHTDAAAQQLKAVVQLNPKDQLSAQLLASLTAPQGAEPAEPGLPAAPARPVDAASLVGDWQARQPDGSTILLRLTGDSTYVWRFTRQGQTQDHSGTYALADNLLILKQGDAPAMVGQVTLLGDGRLNFKLANGNPNDPGLTFSK